MAPFDLSDLPDEFCNLKQALQQNFPFICDHLGDCLDCPCTANKTVCREGCKCLQSCQRRLPPCACSGQCSEDSCFCVQAGFECIPGRCNCSAKSCYNVLEGKKGLVMDMKHSTICGAGNGVFARKHIKKNSYIGEFGGEVVLHDDTVYDTAGGKVMQFQICKDASLNGTNAKDTMWLINHKPDNECNVVFSYIEGPSKRKVIGLAREDIEEGEELFADYNPRHQWSFDNEGYLPNDYVYVNGEVGEHESQSWVGKILQIKDDKEVRVQWAMNPAHLPWRLQKKHKFGPNELLMTFTIEDQDTCELSTLAGRADVEECCQNLVALEGKSFGWNRFYYKNKITPVCELAGEASDEEYNSDSTPGPIQGAK